MRRPGFCRRSIVREETRKVFSEVIEHAVRIVSEAESKYNSQWAAIKIIAAKIGYTPETLRRWRRQQGPDIEQHPGSITVENKRIKALERELRDLRNANKILCLASAFFAQTALGRRLKPCKKYHGR